MSDATDTVTDTDDRPAAVPYPAGVLAGRRALVTGASSGIGRAVAEGLAASGAHVVVDYRSHPEQADDVVQAITAAGGTATAIQADVSDEKAVRDLVAGSVEAMGGLDVLVANAGLQRDAGVLEMELSDWQQVIDTNLTGQFLACREAARVFAAQGIQEGRRSAGSIICMSSVHDVIPWAGHVNYAASKGGIAMLTKTLAQELAGRRIRVNAISPGAIRTPINRDAWQTPQALEELLTLIPYGRIGEPEDVAHAAIWLASDAADYVTGATLYVDGGMTLYPGFRDNG